LQLLLIGADAIAQAIGEPRDAIRKLVDKQGLPAWKSGSGRGTWRARPADLDAWLERQRDARCPNHCLGAVKDSAVARSNARP
jgi:excisionase family DNA binding protein